MKVNIWGNIVECSKEELESYIIENQEYKDSFYIISTNND